jgi:hypothetical protein
MAVAVCNYCIEMAFLVISVPKAVLPLGALVEQALMDV